jgi:hypothetical protein
MRVYIAGPMRGIPLYNFPAFDEAALALVAKGHVPVSPADMDGDNSIDPSTYPPDHDWSCVPEDTDMADFILRDLAALQTCDAILLLPGWKQSVGATAEYHVARWLGLPILCLEY